MVFNLAKLKIKLKISYDILDFALKLKEKVELMLSRLNTTQRDQLLKG